MFLQVAGFDEDDGSHSPAHNKKGSRAGRREGRVKGKGGAEGEPGAAIAGATLRMSDWPRNDQVWSEMLTIRRRYVLDTLWQGQHCSKTLSIACSISTEKAQLLASHVAYL